VKAGKDQLVKHDVTEERSTARKETLDGMNDDRIKALLASANAPASVKENIRKGTTMLRTLTATGLALKELRTQLKEITDEQARIKGNLEKLPPTSELYKRLIDKFDKEETALEKVQKQIGEKVADEKKQQKEFEQFLVNLNAE
jgi:predicted nuclease with TOPRIM domain